MDFFFFSNNEDDDLFTNTFDQSFLPPSFADPGDSLYLVSSEHYDKKGWENSLPGEDSAGNLFSLQIRLLYMRETRQLVIKISQKLQVWDFSGQTNQFFLNDNMSSIDLARPHEEILLELHMYGLLCSIIEKESSNEEEIVNQPSTNGLSSSSALMMNGSVDKVTCFLEFLRPLLLVAFLMALVIWA